MPVEKPWIRVMDEASDPALRQLYDGMRDPRGLVDNILQIHSLHPESLRVHFEFYKLVMHGRSELTRVQREIVAVVVSTLNRCEY